MTKYNPGKIFPPGHFYSPIPDIEDIRRREKKIFRKVKDEEVFGINLNPELQFEMLKIISQYKDDFLYPEVKPSDEYKGYFLNNGLFGGLDALAYFSFLLHFKPKRVIEIGCGYSTLILLDVNKKFFDNSINITLIEPYPSEILLENIKENKDVLINKPVQDVEIGIFTELSENDILFIDSTHVCKIGSDVNYLFFEVIPRLKKGVIIHVHDIFLPDEYPLKWVFEENRAWNEMYVLRAFLMFNNCFEILFGSYYVATRYKDYVEQIFGKSIGGGSFYMRRIC